MVIRLSFPRLSGYRSLSSFPFLSPGTLPVPPGEKYKMGDSYHKTLVEETSGRHRKDARYSVIQLFRFPDKADMLIMLVRYLDEAV